jgi:hypothetical protein
MIQIIFRNLSAFRTKRINRLGFIRGNICILGNEQNICILGNERNINRSSMKIHCPCDKMACSIVTTMRLRIRQDSADNARAGGFGVNFNIETRISGKNY